MRLWEDEGGLTKREEAALRYLVKRYGGRPTVDGVHVAIGGRGRETLQALDSKGLATSGGSYTCYDSTAAGRLLVRAMDDAISHPNCPCPDDTHIGPDHAKGDTGHCVRCGVAAPDEHRSATNFVCPDCKGSRKPKWKEGEGEMPYGTVRVRVVAETWVEAEIGYHGFWRRQPNEVNIFNYAGTLNCFTPEELGEDGEVLRSYLETLHVASAKESEDAQ